MILIIDNYDSFTYNLYQLISSVYPEVNVIRNDKITVNEVIKLKPAGIVLSPGPGRPENAGICVELIRTLPLSIPLLGVCLGLQAIVMAFGGRVIQATEIIHGKPDYIFHYRKELYQNLPLPFQAGRYHSLSADRFTLPKTLIIEAENTSGIIMGIRHVTKPIMGVQFHPESILTPLGDLIIKNFLDFCVHDKGALCA
jgi:anthranilate synthase component 2